MWARDYTEGRPFGQVTKHTTETASEHYKHRDQKSDVMWIVHWWQRVEYQSGQSDFFAGTTVEHIFAQSSKAQRTNMIDAPLSCDAMKAEKENECASKRSFSALIEMSRERATSVISHSSLKPSSLPLQSSSHSSKQFLGVREKVGCREALIAQLISFSKKLARLT